ncbi:MAG: ATP-binding protein [Candidatus Omnitrophica bacterium]|nr:ATP-binding protein [Candidatus Omnitrophota bacterium]
MMRTDPAVGKDFFGRVDILSLIGRRVEALKEGYRQNIAITGRELTGKSSLLNHFLLSLSRDKDIVPIYLEVREEGFTNFAQRFIASMLYGLLCSLGSKPSVNLDHLLQESAVHAPKVISEIGRLNKFLAAKRTDTAYSLLFDLTLILKAETGKSCVIILDEFHNLGSFGIKAPFALFGKKIMVQKETMYIVSSSKVSLIKQILTEKLSLLFGNFEVIELKGFSHQKAHLFLLERFAPYLLSEECRKFMIYITGGGPFYLDLLSRRIKEIAKVSENETLSSLLGRKIKEMARLSDNKPLAFDVLISALESTLLKSDGPLNQYFTSLVNLLIGLEKGDSAVEVLVTIARGARRTKEISLQLKADRRALSEPLETLIRSDIIRRNGVFYYIVDEMFEFWLRHVYHMRMTALVDYPLREQSDFRTSVENLFQGFLEDAKKSSPNRIKSLFETFGNDLVDVQRKSIKLPKFDKIIFDSCLGQDDCLLGKVGGKFWICRISERPVSEEDVTKFCDYIASRRKIYPIAKKALIALEGMEANARLLAKEEKIIIWDINYINHLKALYGHHHIIS